MDSLWTATSETTNSKKLCEDIKTDVLIIGGGMAGLLTAYYLKNAGVDCVIVEANTVGSGVTADTTAKITSQHGLIYSKLIKEFGVEKAKVYLKANEDAIKQYENLCREIDCDFERRDAYVYSLHDKVKLYDELIALDKIGVKAEFVKNLPLPFDVAGAIRFCKQAQFHPLKFISAIKDQLNIYENTRVREMVGHTAVTDSGRITAEKIVVATHFPFINKHGSYFIKMYQQRSYVIALENAPDVNGMYIDEAENGLSFRNYDGLLLLGGGGHRTGKKGGNWQVLRSFAGKVYPNATEKYHWATQDCMTLDGAPYIGNYSARTPYLYVATGFNKWGMTSSMVSGMLLSDLILGKNNPYAPVFNPSRAILRPQLAANAIEAVAGWISPTKKRCPHLGCGLKWNPTEHTWDCSCHGSRFKKDGTLIDNPANGNLKQ